MVLIDNAGIRELNRRYLDRDESTDVLAFDLPPVPGEEAPSGEIVVNTERAVEIGRRRAGGPAVELAYYLAHACDHLCGGVDHDPRDRRRMQQRERRWLRHRSVHPHMARLVCPNRRQKP